MTWNRYRYVAATPINTTLLVRYYIDAVRSDGLLFRAGVDVAPGANTDQEIQQMLHANLDYFLPKVMGVTNVGPDAFKGQDGWVEA